MAVTKSIALSEELYSDWLRYQADHPAMSFNQLVREAIELYMAQDAKHEASIPER